jgi:hypothetical protein
MEGFILAATDRRVLYHLLRRCEPVEIVQSDRNRGSKVVIYETENIDSRDVV